MTPSQTFSIGIQSWIIREREKKSSLGVGLNPAPSMGVALVVCPMVLRVCKKCTAKEIPTLDPSTGNCVAHTPPLHRCSSTLQQPCHCKTMQNCTPAAAGTCKILRSNFFLSIIFRLGFALTPSQYYYSSSSQPKQNHRFFWPTRGAEKVFATFLQSKTFPFHFASHAAHSVQCCQQPILVLLLSRNTYYYCLPSTLALAAAAARIIKKIGFLFRKLFHSLQIIVHE